MVEKLTPTHNVAMLMERHSLIQVMQGTGGIEVDFQVYHNWADKLLFLEKGQYIKFLGHDFQIRKIEFPDDILFHNADVRVLFKHLIQLGYIHFPDCVDCEQYLNSTIFSEHIPQIIDVSTQQWFWQNPFKAKPEEYHIIFDVKDLIDTNFRNTLSAGDWSDLLNTYPGFDALALMKNKVGLSVTKMFKKKKILEGKKEVAFSDKQVQEIAYELGFDDPAYFNRSFKAETGQTPTDFRAAFNYPRPDHFLQDLYALLEEHHQSQHQIAFYAQQMHLSVKTLSRKVQKKLQTSLGQLIRQWLITSAKSLLAKGETVKSVAYQLGFEEPHHFSAFFKLMVGDTPSSYKEKMSK